jgi:hypothetical protein
MDQDAEMAKLKWWGIGIVAFVISGWWTFSELNYAVRGLVADGDIRSIQQGTQSGRRGRTREVWKVEYDFPDKTGARISARETLPIDWSPAADRKVQVQYIPGSDGSARIYGRGNTFAVIVFIVICVVMSFFAIRLFLEARAATEEVYGTGRRKKSR